MLFFLFFHFYPFFCQKTPPFATNFAIRFMVYLICYRQDLIRYQERKKTMEQYSESMTCARMVERGERKVLALRKEEGDALYLYTVAIGSEKGALYSIYAEFQCGDVHTVGEIPGFSCDRDKAEAFCCMLERFGITPLSLDAVYEDLLTP